MCANFLLSSSCAYRQGLGLHPIHPHVPAMQAHFNPNAAADSCAVLAESWANGVVEMWFVVCATAPLLVEHPRPQTQPQMGWGFLCHCSWIRLWPRSFGFWQFWQPFRKSEPWRLFASRICTCLEVATWCCRTQHIADCQAQSQEQIVPKKGPTVEGCDAQIEGFRSFSSKSRSFSFSVPEVSDELVSIWKHRKAEPLWKEALYISKWCRWRVFENVSGSLKGDGADADSDIAWSKEV